MMLLVVVGWEGLLDLLTKLEGFSFFEDLNNVQLA